MKMFFSLCSTIHTQPCSTRCLTGEYSQKYKVRGRLSPDALRASHSNHTGKQDKESYPVHPRGGICSLAQRLNVQEHAYDGHGDGQLDAQNPVDLADEATANLQEAANSSYMCVYVINYLV